MPIDLKIVPAKEFMRTNAKGEFDLEGTKKVFLSIFAKMKEAKVSEVVMDVREASAKLSVFQIYELVSVLEQVGCWRTWKIAMVLNQKDEFDRAKFFELCAQNRGYQVGAFKEFEEAVTWLYPPQET